MGKRTITIVISSIDVLSAISVFSIGFATWATADDDIVQLDGIIAVGAVNTSSANQFIETPVADHAVCFGRPTEEQIESYGFSDPWLTVTGTKYEALSTFIDIKVSGLTDTNFKDILDIGELKDTSNRYALAYNEGLVGALPTPTNDDLTYVGENCARLTITFTWGNAFNNENPYKFYNSQVPTAALEKDASTKLTKLNNYLNGISYSIKISTKDSGE